MGVTLLEDVFGDKKIISIIEYDTVVALILWLIKIGFIIFFLTTWFQEFYIIEKNAVIHKTGLFFPREKIHMLDKVENIAFEQSLLGKIFHYGDIKIKFTSDAIPVVIEQIANPRQFIHFLEHREKISEEKKDD